MDYRKCLETSPTDVSLSCKSQCNPPISKYMVSMDLGFTSYVVLRWHKRKCFPHNFLFFQSAINMDRITSNPIYNILCSMQKGYYPTSLFTIIAIVYCINLLNNRKMSIVVPAYLAAYLALFILFLPVITGFGTSQQFARFLSWLPGWYFG